VEAFNLSHPSTPLSLSIGIAVANDKEQLRLAVAEAERRMLAQKLSKNNLSE
jgi:GGDEF domain-containing protein